MEGNVETRILVAACALFTIFTVGHFNTVYANVSADSQIDKSVRWKLPSMPETTEAERKEYFPTAEKMNAMRAHIKSVGIIYGDGTHYPGKMLQVGIPYRAGVVVYFATFIDGTHFWIFEEWTTFEKGFRVAFWRFFENKITYYSIDFPSGQGPATEYINSDHPLWSEALQKSKLVWKRLCDKYTCSEDEISP